MKGRKKVKNMTDVLELMNVTGSSIIVLRNDVKNSTIASDLSHKPSNFPSIVINSADGIYPFKKKFFDSVVYLGAPSPDLYDIPNYKELRQLAKTKSKFFLVR